MAIEGKGIYIICSHFRKFSGRNFGKSENLHYSRSLRGIQNVPTINQEFKPLEGKEDVLGG
jgi:hypothetical protein